MAAFTQKRIAGGQRRQNLTTAVQTALDALDSSEPEPEIAAALAKVKPTRNWPKRSAAAQDAALAFDNATKSINKSSDKFDETLMTGDKKAFRDFSAARLRYTAARYDAEARLKPPSPAFMNCRCARTMIPPRSITSAARKFFYGMLAAQMAVIIATFAIAARQRNFLWSIAAAAGTAAVAFAVYVYLYV